jgi:hypothetical protein
MNPIENDHNLYILGAGFSAIRGMPVIADFMFALRDAQAWLSEQKRAREAKAIERVLEFRLSATPAAYRIQLDLENIEELFSFASIADERLSDDIRLAIAATLDFRRAVSVERFLEFTVVGRQFVRKKNWSWNTRDAGDGGGSGKAERVEFYVNAMLGGFSPEGRVGKNTFITLNYDLLLEEALSALDVQFSYGVSTYVSPASSLLIAEDAQLLVLKLHGSVNWALLNEQPNQLGVMGYAELVKNNLTPFLIPPTWRKAVSHSLPEIWERAREQIQTATRLVIIGFSIPETDQDIKYLLAAGLRENISLREIVFVNPAIQQLEPRLTRLFGDLDKRPQVRRVPLHAERFCQPGVEDGIGSIGRPIHESVQNVLLAHWVPAAAVNTT